MRMQRKQYTNNRLAFWPFKTSLVDKMRILA